MTEELGDRPAPRWPEADSLRAVLGSTFSLLGARPRPLLGLFVAASALGLGLQYLAWVAARSSSSDALASTLAFIVPAILSVFLGSLAAGAVAGVVARHVAGEGEVTVTSGLRALRPVVRDAIASGLLASLVFLLLYLLLFPFPFLFLPFFYGPAVVIQAVVIQRLPFNHALGRARSLMRGRTWRLIGYVFLVSLLAWTLPLGLLSTLDALTLSVSALVYVPLQVAAEAAAGAFVAVVGSVLYLGLRLRREDYGPAGLHADLA